MANNGLLMSLQEFESLPKSKQLSCLYENQVSSNKVQKDILREIKGYKLHQKIQYPWLAGITMALIFMFKFLVGGV